MYNCNPSLSSQNPFCTRDLLYTHMDCYKKRMGQEAKKVGESFKLLEVTFQVEEQLQAFDSTRKRAINSFHSRQTLLPFGVENQTNYYYFRMFVDGLSLSLSSPSTLVDCICSKDVLHNESKFQYLPFNLVSY